MDPEIPPHASPECVRCHLPTEEGFLLDLVSDPNIGAKYAQEWVAGPPEPGYVGGGVRSLRKERHRVVAFRCPKCGRLELTAP